MIGVKEHTAESRVIRRMTKLRGRLRLYGRNDHADHNP